MHSFSSLEDHSFSFRVVFTALVTVSVAVRHKVESSGVPDGKDAPRWL